MQFSSITGQICHSVNPIPNIFRMSPMKPPFRYRLSFGIGLFRPSNKPLLFKGFALWCLVLLACHLTGCDVSKGTQNSNSLGQQSPDPVVVDAPLAYVQRPLPREQNGTHKPNNIQDPAAFNPGAKLIIRPRASASAPETAITETLFPPLPPTTTNGKPTPQDYDVKDLFPSRDGKKLLFALRAPALANVSAERQPTWDIWEYTYSTGQAKPVITDTALAQRGEDVQPAYLADGRIIFSSTRQETTRIQNQDALRGYFQGQTEDGGRPAFNLHMVNPDGSGLAQVSFNPSDDLQPTPLNTGEIAFLRWDRFNHDTLSLYKMNPDGSGIRFYYGYHSQDTGTANTSLEADRQAVFNKPIAMDDNRLLVNLRPRISPQHGGDIVAINTEAYYEHNRSLNGASTGSAQTSLTNGNVFTHGKLVDQKASPAGYFNSASPMNDGTGRLLVSWSPCLILTTTSPEARPCLERLSGNAQPPPEYALWVYNPFSQTQLPIIIPPLGVQLMEPTLLREQRPLPSPPLTLDPSLRMLNQGVLHIHNINSLGNPAFAEAKYLRLIKPIPRLSGQDFPLVQGAFGVGGDAVGMREIIAYAPIETDGSIQLKVPAETPFTLEWVNAQGQRIGPRHNNWISLAAGETLSCEGCHQSNDNSQPHGRLDTSRPSATDIATSKPVQTPSLELDNARYSALLSSINQNPKDIRCLPKVPAPPQWKAPLSDTCSLQWSATCGININYLENIQPLWEADRRQCNSQGQITADNTCTACHNRSGEHLARLQQEALQNPLAPNAYEALLALDVQLELLGTKRNANSQQVISYNELLRTQNKEEYLDGVSQEVRVNMPINQQNPDGTTTLVDNFVPVPLAAPLNLNGASNAQNRLFFNRFTTATDRHYQLLSPEELRLISEWLDAGAQYYNEPAKARQAN